MRFIHEIFLTTKFFVCFPIIILMSIKRASFQTEIVFKTTIYSFSLFLLSYDVCQRYQIHSICIVCIMTFFSQRSEARIVYIGIWFVSKAYKRLPFPNLTKIGDLDFCILNTWRIIQMRRVVSFDVGG